MVHHGTSAFYLEPMATNVARYSPSCPPVRSSSNFQSFFIQHGRQSKPLFCASETGPLPTEKPTLTTFVNPPR
ncbi:unnamed protein product [Fusarium venenatum]|uniref:Uncharacterized protein n=1 Tax=Fusarium venenatum TaxID=56646 RepID=A0A2L2TU57_9HYPO|nr:uncharacterized protein FVRRES_01412 [Fusarium venenatum]CEI64900.1 unnamed protein product [Fusarium venenatum]